MALRLIAHLHKATHQVGLYIHRELSEIAVSQAEAHVLSFSRRAARAASPTCTTRSATGARP